MTHIGKQETDHLENLGIDGRIILKFMFKRLDGKQGLDCYGSGWGQMASSYECGNEDQGSIKCGEILDELGTYQLLKTNYASQSWLVGWSVTYQYFGGIHFLSFQNKRDLAPNLLAQCHIPEGNSPYCHEKLQSHD